MVFITPFIGAAVLLSGLASALPRPQDSAVGDEVAVSAPNGTPITDSVELASQTAAEAQATASQTIASSSYGSSGYGSSSSYGSSESSGGYGSGSAENSNQWSSSSSWAPAATSTAASSYSTPAYGSGQSNWGGSGYDDCVSQCIATYGAPAASYVPTATSNSDAGSSGSGATHTVIVAPSQGVLRYVPFAVNASVGDTIKFMWGANAHTVTKSSELLPCNKTGDALFASGSQDKDFVFTQVVNDTNPTYFFCGTPGHCQQGMFGIINPPSALNAPTSVSGMMSSLAASNPDVSAYSTYTTSQTTSNPKAAKWGGNINLAAVPEWAHSLVAENVLFTRNFLASNAEVMKEDGTIDLSAAGTTPLMIPQDIGAALNNAGASSPSNTSVSASSAPQTSETAAPSNAAENQSNGASSLASPRAFVALFVVISTFFAL